MIVGEYDSTKHQTTIALRVSDGVRDETITAVIDTGFSGFLMLPRSLLGGFAFDKQQDRPVVLANGSEASLPVYTMTVTWHGRNRAIFGYISDGGEPLVGMKLLRGSIVTLELIENGSVTIERA